MNARKQPSLSWQSSKVNQQGDFHSRISFDEKTPLLTGDIGAEFDVIVPGERKKDGRKKKKPSLLKVLARTCGPSLLMCWACKLVCDILIFIGPILQG